MHSRSKIPQRVRGSNGDLSKDGTQSAAPQKLRRKDCQQDSSQNTFCRDSQGDRELHDPNTCHRGVELQLEREKTKTLQEELERARADVLTVTQRAHDLQLQLDREIESSAKRESEKDKILLQKLMDEQDAEPQEEWEDKLHEQQGRTHGSRPAVVQLVAVMLVLTFFIGFCVLFTPP
ncbi:Hypothetical protein SMAX5B_008131 [Scophthalmus maximus]|uniref:Uncharacterized protein n=1 Tax=Scophthalmus maximus TaxID=52904 RepID=A0A2U9CSY4_SCOMX|nr:Hypothetical protein SMAX5B_008131 [Scophthalmus maximus]